MIYEFKPIMMEFKCFIDKSDNLYTLQRESPGLSSIYPSLAEAKSERGFMSFAIVQSSSLLVEDGIT